jgi:NhaP-type Na+/H+ or K+/H+ antiporter
MIVKVFLMGIAAGLVLQAITFSAFVTILKFWGKDPRPQDLSNRAMYFLLFLLSQADIAVYSVVIVMFIFFLTRSGPMYMRKKFDSEDGIIRTKEGESTISSLSTRKFLFRAGITFLFGIMLGSAAPWVAVDYKMGLPMTLGPLIATLILDLFLLPIMFRSFDWAQEEEGETSSSDEGQEEAGYAVV